ncbi:hypothetical protein Rhopal_002235-T1 [Rhodotorula paludigena]|uniref:F-box domain-containing protein n=1 Tax=Rhodotorula paludigena TaxID=86838 RepID=A0AAV5GA45_9BASI|nr:hypothetical protein Rhopal_002235-T1 [Rhodotorula paludigena]
MRRLAALFSCLCSTALESPTPSPIELEDPDHWVKLPNEILIRIFHLAVEGATPTERASFGLNVMLLAKKWRAVGLQIVYGPIPTFVHARSFCSFYRQTKECREYAQSVTRMRIVESAMYKSCKTGYPYHLTRLRHVCLQRWLIHFPIDWDFNGGHPQAILNPGVLPALRDLTTYAIRAQADRAEKIAAGLSALAPQLTSLSILDFTSSPWSEDCLRRCHNLASLRVCLASYPQIDASQVSRWWTVLNASAASLERLSLLDVCGLASGNLCPFVHFVQALVSSLHPLASDSLVLPHGLPALRRIHVDTTHGTAVVGFQRVRPGDVGIWATLAGALQNDCGVRLTYGSEQHSAWIEHACNAHWVV